MIQDYFGYCFCQEKTVTLNSSGQVTLTPADVVMPDALTGGGTFSLSEAAFDCSDLGANIVTVTRDFGGNITTCDATVIVLDGPPLLTCQDINLPLNILGEATLTPAQIILSATDDCGITNYNLSQSQFTCADLGAQNVMLTVTDGNSHSTSCNAVVTVTGLPCEFNDPGTTGVGTSTGSVAYNPSTGVFSVNSVNNAGSPTTDNVYFIPSELCGDGEITAEITSVSASGFAGIMMRETLLPGAKKFAVYTNFGANVRREIRVNTNGPANIGQIFRPNTHWMRIRRIGNTFTAFSSTNGTTWSMLISANIGMTSCIEVGLATYSLNPATPVSAMFDNVQIIDYVPLIDPLGGDQYLSAPEVDIFPNPTSGEVTLQWGAALGQSADLDIYDVSGRLVYHRRWDIVDQTQESLDLSALENGLYQVRIAQSDAEPKVVRLVITR
ncbi:MAG: T9SS type A sorting domain-containing protein [Saprospiraceae bacterium]|nr:T9SS type A sorting domain-containing protein [Saprospiraceae bacterium]